MRQKGFISIFVVIVILVSFAIIGAGIWSYFKKSNFGFNTNQDNQQKKFEETGGVSEVYDNSHIKNLSPCKGVNLLTNSPMDLDKIPVIAPRGGISPPGHTLPSDHGGIMYPGAQETNLYKAETEIKAPSDGHIFRIEKTLYSKNGKKDREDYDIAFSPCREFVIYMGHVGTISSNLQKVIDSPQEHCDTHKEFETQYSFCTYPKVDYVTHSGEVIGTVKSDGVRVMGMDFGAFDTRTAELKFLGNHFPPARRLQSLHNVCPWDYFVSPLKEKLYDKLAAKSEPRCGLFMQDKDNTIAGNWEVKNYKPQKNDSGDWSKHLSIVHDSTNPEIGVIAFGGVIHEPGIVGFSPTHEGVINREPTEVTADGNIHCFTMGAPDSLSNQKSTFRSGRVLVQLVDKLTLKAEFQQGNCESSVNFNSPTIYQR